MWANRSSGGDTGGGSVGNGGRGGVTYNDIKKAVSSEQELMRLMLELPDDRFRALMENTRTAAGALGQMKTQEADIARQEANKAAEERKKTEEMEKTKRHEQSLSAQKEMEQLKFDQRKEELDIKTNREKEIVDYRIKQELDAQSAKERKKVETRREMEMLDAERDRRESDARQAEHLRQLEMIRVKAEERERVRRQSEIDMAEFRREQQRLYRQEFGEEMLREELEKHKITVQGDVEKERAKWETLMDFSAGEKGRERLFQAGIFFGGLVTLGYALHTVYPIARESLRSYFLKPSLVSESRSNSMLARLFGSTSYAAKSTILSKSRREPDLILSAELRNQYDRVMNGTKNAAVRRGLQSNMLLYGPPGTGKTMLARKLARDSNMDFAIMSGPAFEQFETSEAIKEIKKLFRWAKKSRNGLLLFVDEADTFLLDRNRLPSNRIPVLNEWLAQTGTESREFSVVYCTNRDHVLDPAVHSRITKSLEITPPTLTELERMVRQYVELYVVDEIGQSSTLNRDRSTTEDVLEHIDAAALARQMQKTGFVGRDVTNYSIALVQALYASADGTLSKDLAWQVLEEQLQKKNRERQHSLLRESANLAPPS